MIDSLLIGYIAIIVTWILYWVDGLYMDFAREVAIRYASQREEEVRMEMVEKIKNLAVDEMFAEQVKVAVLQTLTTKDK